MPRNVLCLTGLSGAGKSTVCDALASRGVPAFYTADIMQQLYGCRMPSNKLQYGDSFLRPEGLVAVVLDFILQKKVPDDTIALDSLRSIEEWQFVKNLSCQVWLIAVVCGRRERMRRLKLRDGSDVSRIRERDTLELGQTLGSRFNIGQLIAIADYHIDTSGRTTTDTAQLEEILADVDGLQAGRTVRAEARHSVLADPIGELARV